MADIAALALSVDSSQVKQATVALKEMPAAASAAERAAQKWSTTTKDAARSSEDYSKRVQGVIKSLEFERAQLARNSTEQARFQALRRAGVAASSAEGVAITASVRALQAQKDALGQTSLAARGLNAAWGQLKGLLGAFAIAAIVDKLFQMGKAAFDAAAGMDELAEQVGLTAVTFQALTFAATQNGLKTEQLETGLSKFSQKMGEAAEGSKEMIEALNALGVKNLDVAGKLRPTEDLLTDVAKAITSIDDPARRSAAAVDFFGKAGTRMLPLLGEIAKGTDALASSAQTAGAVISDFAIKKLDKLSDGMERSALITRAWAAELIAKSVDIGERLIALGEGVVTALTRQFKSLVGSVDQWLSPVGDKIGQVGASAAAMFVEAFSALPETLGQLFTNAWEAARVASAKGINAIIDAMPEWMRPGGRLDTTPQGTGPVGAGLGDRISAAGAQAAADMAARQQAARDQAALGAAFGGAGGVQARGAHTGVAPFASPATTGAGTSAIKGAGAAAEDAEKKYTKLITTLTQTATAQDAMTAAAGRGETAFEATKVHLDAQQKALEIYGKALDDTDPKLRKIEELLLRISQGKAAEAFSVATTELEKQNVILEAQIRLMNEAPEIQAREIALIKAKQEAEKAGTAVTADMIEQRRKAIEQNETLKNQQEELKRAQDLWTAPLKSALESIQQTAADAFEGILESGKFSFDSLKDVFTKTLRRMAAEFLALATIRPVMSVLVNAISPSMAQQMGMGSTGSASTGGLSGLFGGGGISDFLGQTLFGGSEIMGPLQPGAASLGSTGGLTVGGALGGAAGIGLGAYSLLSGGGSAGSMLGGGASILGGAVSLLGPMLGLGAAAGPIGLGIGLLGSILPSLFGGQTKPTITNQAYGQLSYGSGGFGTSGGAWGPDANSSSLTGPLGQIGSSMDAVFKAFGGVKDAGKVWGVALESFSQQYGDDSTFSNQTSFLVGPGGQKRQWGMGSNASDVGMDAAGVAATLNSILEGAVGDISDNMRKALEGVNLSGKDTFETLGTVVSEIMAFDKAIEGFGTTTTDAAAAIQAVDDSFAGLYATAEKYSLDVARLDEEKNRLRLKATEDFSDSITQSLLGFTDPLQASLNDLEKQRQKDIANNADFVRLVTGYTDQAANIEQLYYLRRNELIDQANQEALAAQQQAVSAATSSLGNLQALIRQLTPGGALSNLDPAGQLAGLRASYNASYAQAAADPTNADAISRFTSDAQSFLEFNRSFTGGSTAYVASAAEALQRAQSLEVGVTQGARTMTADTGTHTRLDAILVAVNDSNSPERNAKLDTLIGLMARFVANQAA